MAGMHEDDCTVPAVSIEGFALPAFSGDEGWIPPVQIVLTEGTRSNLRRILPALVRDHNLLLVGDAGVGKNALIYYINSLRNHPTIRYSFNEDTLPEDLVGSFRLQGGGFVWADGPLTRALRSGATFVADEMNLASPEVLRRFQSVFADRELVLLEGDGSHIQPAPGFSFVATQNPAEGFEGRKHLPREIQKYFATVHLDAYSDEELVAILSGLFPDIPASVAETLVRINRCVEDLVVQKKIGARDMERYHFNLRNLKRLACRVQDSPDHLVLEVYDIYVAPFRKEEDRTLLRASIDPLLRSGGFTPAKIRSPVEIHVDTEGGHLDIGRARLPLHSGRDDSASTRMDATQMRLHVERAFERFLPVPERLASLESIARALQFGENILLECDSNVEPEAYIQFFSAITSTPMASIVLSRGMHTSDVLGGLKPVNGGVEWVDGPLTAGLRAGHGLLIQGLEAAGPELVEKMNMLMDDARALALPAESGEIDPLRLHQRQIVAGIKYFRTTKTTPTVSRAFRNRFTCIVIPPLTEGPGLKEIIQHHPGIRASSALADIIYQFHVLLSSHAERREIGRSRLQPYRFGLTNLERMLDYIRYGRTVLNVEGDEAGTGHAGEGDGNLSAAGLAALLRAGASLAYTAEIADASERRSMEDALERLMGGAVLDELLREWKEQAKKKLHLTRRVHERIHWDQAKHWRDAATGRASWDRIAREIRKGLEINSPETGGSTKEGADAWYGADTKGNRGVGEPGAGGGAWGYRTEELYQEFLKKRRPLWSYELGVSLEGFLDVFAPELDRVALNLDHLLDPDLRVHRRYGSEGSRVDARRYLAYLSGRGDDRVFDRSIIQLDEDRLRGVEILFAVNKGRRIFNFEYAVAVLVAIMSAVELLDAHRISSGVIGYSDLTNSKTRIDLDWHKLLNEPWSADRQRSLFDGMASSWQGDTVPESQILESLASSFTADAKTRILVLISDFRGARARVSREGDQSSRDSVLLRDGLERLSARGIVALGVGLGPRGLAGEFFDHHLSITDVNFTELPSLLARTLSELVDRYHRH